MGSAVVPPRFIVQSEETLRWVLVVRLEVMGRFFPPNQELNVV